MKFSKLATSALVALIVTGMARPATSHHQCGHQNYVGPGCEAPENEDSENGDSSEDSENGDNSEESENGDSSEENQNESTENDGDDSIGIESNSEINRAIHRSGARMIARSTLDRTRICDRAWHTSTPFDATQFEIRDEIRDILAQHEGHGVYAVVQEQVVEGVAYGFVTEYIVVAAPEDEFVCVTTAN